MIRKITANDKLDYISMSEQFYNSDAVMQPVDKQHFINTFNELINSDAYADCYIIEKNNKISGYALLSKTFSNEAGGMVLWLEEIYIKPEFRGQNLGNEFFSFLMKELAPKYKRVRLEVESYNKTAIGLYEKNGFEFLPYSQMYIDF